MYDYSFHITVDGQTRAIRYQQLLDLLEIGDEIVHGKPLSEGGAPQAQFLQGLLAKAWKGAEIGVFFNGNQIF